MANSRMRTCELWLLTARVRGFSAPIPGWWSFTIRHGHGGHHRTPLSLQVKFHLLSTICAAIYGLGRRAASRCTTRKGWIAERPPFGFRYDGEILNTDILIPELWFGGDEFPHQRNTFLIVQ